MRATTRTTHGDSSNRIHDVVRKALVEHASDVLFREGEIARLRIDGALRGVGTHEFVAEELKAFFLGFVPRSEIERFESLHEIDFSAQIPDLCRTRVNLFIQQGRVCVALRLIPSRIPTMDELYLPRACREFTTLNHGLVLITGPTGSGKTTTLAAMLDHINQTRALHILTIEDPIEFVYPQKSSTISQREVGRDTSTFEAALRSCFRQNPDVVLLGEMRDATSMGAAITLAETGHLIFSTLHTNSCAQTVNRIVDSFPQHAQDQVRSQLALTLAGVIAQRLIPLKGRHGRVAAREVLVCNRAVKNLIRENKLSHIASAMQTGHEDGMITMTRSLLNLLDRGLITVEAALAATAERKELLEALGLPAAQAAARAAQP